MRSALNIFTICCLLFVGVNVNAGLVQSDSASLEVENVAVMVYAQDKQSKKYLKVARSRFESILADNGITVLDQEKADELKNVWNQLEDPGYFVTAEDFVEKSEKYALDGVLRVYLHSDIAPSVAGFFTATAHVDIRFVGSDAKVISLGSKPMGAPGNPPSDGLTQTAAVVNAIQRAVDVVSGSIGLEVIDVANPRLLKFKLDGPFNIATPNPALLQRKQQTNDAAVQYASLQNTDWVKETITCNAVAPGNNYVALGGYVFQKTFGRFSYWSNLHLIDLQSKAEALVFGPLSKKRSKSGTSKIVDCMFVYNWRFLAALTEHKLYLWDTERNVLLTSSELQGGFAGAEMNYFRQGKDDFIMLMNGDAQTVAFKVARYK